VYEVAYERVTQNRTPTTNTAIQSFNRFSPILFNFRTPNGFQRSILQYGSNCVQCHRKQHNYLTPQMSEHPFLPLHHSLSSALPLTWMKNIGPIYMFSFNLRQSIIDVQYTPPVWVQSLWITICTGFLVPVLQSFRIPFPLLGEQVFEILPTLSTPYS
jgi:hypothetical protein